MTVRCKQDIPSVLQLLGKGLKIFSPYPLQATQIYYSHFFISKSSCCSIIPS